MLPILHSHDQRPIGGLAVKTHRHSSQVTLNFPNMEVVTKLMRISMQVSEIDDQSESVFFFLNNLFRESSIVISIVNHQHFYVSLGMGFEGIS